MNKLLILPITTLILVGCNKKSTSSTKDFDYSDVLDLTIEWSHVLNVKSGKYYAYIYSETCSHCKEIKQDIISYALDNYGTLYFVRYVDKIPIIDSGVPLLEKSNIEELGIVGTPSLFLIENHIVKGYYAGSKEIVKTLTNE